ncbi:MAG: ACT domain-containing protein [Lachnospiraceae bacterium]|nr:ACT domain-containing protein [Lachnospiraceae bacterium]
MKKIIITVVGKDRVGIIARVCTYLSENQINILDITQTIVSDMFNMMVIADMEKSDRQFDVIADELKNLGDGMGLRILAQKEEIFTEMHRI